MKQLVLPIKDSNILHEVEDTLLHNFKAGRRNYTIFQVGKATLLRVSDLLALRRNEIFNNDGTIAKNAYIRDKKTGKPNTLYLKQSSPNLCVKYFSQAQVVQGMRMHPCLSTITLEGAVKGAPSAHLEEVPLTASERVIHLTQLLVFVVPLPILLVQQPS